MTRRNFQTRSKVLKETIAEADILVSHLSRNYHSLHIYDKATQAALTALDLARLHGYQLQEGLALQMLGLIDRDNASLEEARNLLVGAYDIIRSCGRIDIAKDVEGSLSVVYRRLQRYREAGEIVKRHLAEARDTGEQRDEAIALTRLGTLMYAQGDYPTAREHLISAHELNKKLGRGNAYVYHKLAAVALAEGYFDDARAYAKEAKEIFERSGSVYDVEEVKALIANIQQHETKQ